MCNKKPIEACKEKLLEAIEEAEVKAEEVEEEYAASQARRRYAQLRNKLIGTVNSLRFFR